MSAVNIPNPYERVAHMKRLAFVAQNRLNPDDTLNRVLLDAALQKATSDPQDETAVKRFMERLPSDLVLILDKNI